MRKLFLFVGIFGFVLVIAAVIGFWLDKENTAPLVKGITTISRGKEGLAKVIRVIDGDTIEIEGGERVRYIGIDTPETMDPRKPIQCFGVQASRKNKELVEGRKVRLERDIADRDKYNRLLRYVWVGDIFVNLELVKQGFAYSYSYPPDIKYQDQFIRAQEESKKANVGLWFACPAEKLKESGTSTTIAPKKSVEAVTENIQAQTFDDNSN